MLPQADWAGGCVELNATPTGYYLKAECCTFLTLPPLPLATDRTFTAVGEYNVFTGAGYAKSFVVVSGVVSADDKTLSLTYTINQQLSAYRLTKGEKAQGCACYCD